MNKRKLALALLTTACGAKSPPAAPPPSPTLVDAGTLDQSSEPASTAPGASREQPHAVLPGALSWTPLPGGGASMAVVSGDPETEPASLFIKWPAGPAMMLSHASDLHVVVVSGVMVNSVDGATATKPTTLPAQSYWYQPAGVAHAPTCTTDGPCVTFVQATGRLGVTPAQPAKGATRDVRYVEKRAKDVAWSPLEKSIPAAGQKAPLWGDASSQPNGMLLKLKAGEAPAWHIHKTEYQAVVLAGTVTHTQSGRDPLTLPVGAYVWQPGGYKHAETCNAGGADCVLYVRFAGELVTKVAE